MFEVESDSLGKVGNFSEVSESATKIVADAIANVAGNGSDQLEVDMVGFSRGAGGAVAVADTLGDMGISTSKIADLDGKLGSTDNKLYGLAATANVQVFRPTEWTPVQMLAPMVGLHSDIYKAGSDVAIGTSGTFKTNHHGMDLYSGALGCVENWLLGGGQ